MRKLLATTSPKMVVFVASDNLSRAMSFGYKLISGTGHCKNFQTWVVVFPSMGMTFVVNKPTSHGARAID